MNANYTKLVNDIIKSDEGSRDSIDVINKWADDHEVYSTQVSSLAAKVMLDIARRAYYAGVEYASENPEKWCVRNFDDEDMKLGDVIDKDGTTVIGFVKQGDEPVEIILSDKQICTYDPKNFRSFTEYVM